MTAPFKPEAVIRPQDEATVQIIEIQADAWWRSLSFEQKMSAYSIAVPVVGIGQLPPRDLTIQTKNEGNHIGSK